MANYEWNILSLSCYPQAEGEQDVVFQVSWQCAASEGSFPNAFGAVATGCVPVTYQAGTTFTPYDQLTQDQVWGWVNSQIDRTQIEEGLQVQINAQKTPVVVTPPLPWAQQPVSE